MEATDPISPSRARKALKIAGWTTVAVGALLSFTLAKLPEDRIGQLLLGTLNQQLEAGSIPIEILADRTRLSIFPFPGVRLEGITLKSRDMSGKVQRIRWSQLKVSPSLLDLVIGRMGGTLRITPQGAESPSLTASGWMRGDSFSMDLRLNNADLGEAGVGILPLAAQINGKLPLEGSVSIRGPLSQMSGWEGSIQLVPGKVELPAQKLMGFPIPSLLIRGGEIRAAIQGGKARVDSVKLGRIAESGDDLSGVMTGEATLGKTWDASQLKLKVQLKLSESVLKSLFLIDGLLGASKTPAGIYSFELQGPSFAPNLVPAAAGN